MNVVKSIYTSVSNAVHFHLPKSDMKIVKANDLAVSILQKLKKWFLIAY